MYCERGGAAGDPDIFLTELKVCWERSTSPLKITFFRTALCENDRATWLHALVNQYGCKQVKIKHERPHINLTVFTFDKQHEIQLLIMDTWHFGWAILWFPCTRLSLNHPELFKPSHLTSGVQSNLANVQPRCKTADWAPIRAVWKLAAEGLHDSHVCCWLQNTKVQYQHVEPDALM